MDELSTFCKSVLHRAIQMAGEGEDSRIRAVSNTRSPEDWTYSKSFDATPEAMRAEVSRIEGEGLAAFTLWDEGSNPPAVALVCEGLDLRSRSTTSLLVPTKRPNARFPAVLKVAGSETQLAAPTFPAPDAPYATWDLKEFTQFIIAEVESAIKHSMRKNLTELRGLVLIDARGQQVTTMNMHNPQLRSTPLNRDGLIASIREQMPHGGARLVGYYWTNGNTLTAEVADLDDGGGARRFVWRVRPAGLLARLTAGDNEFQRSEDQGPVERADL